MSSQKPDGKSDLIQKTREEIKAEREAKKVAKAAKAKAAKSKNRNDEADNSTSNITLVTDNKIPETSIDCAETREKVSGKSEKVENVKNGPLETSSNKVLKLIVQMDAMDVRDAKDKKIAREVSKQDTGLPLNVAVTNEPTEDESREKSKAELRAERRAKQEAQRATKQQHLAKSNVKPQTVEQTVKPVETVSESPVKNTVAKNANESHEINLFKHLYKQRMLSSIKVAAIKKVHPAIIRLGVRYESKVVAGSNARCIALLAAIKEVIQDFEKPAQVDFVRGLETTLKECRDYLDYYRPSSVSMQNAMSHLKWHMTQFPPTLSDDEAKNKLQSIIDTYINEQILLADQAISLTIQSKISNGNVILTYGCSSLICKILVDAHAAGKQFHVIVVDGRPWLEGRELLRRLVIKGLECSYIFINALSFIMPEVSKVFLGAHAILANGAVMSRAGTAQVALIARAFNVPVLVACETHKSCEQVQTDSIVYNELGDADELVKPQSKNSNSKKSVLSNWRTKKLLNLLNITYDVTPADLVTAVVTELAILPCTSVPVILRIKPSEI